MCVTKMFSYMMYMNIQEETKTYVVRRSKKLLKRIFYDVSAI